MASDYAAKIAALEDALAAAESTVEANGERVTSRSIAEIKDAINYMRAQMTRAPQTTFAVFDR